MRTRLALIVACALLSSSCAVSGLSFVQDERITFVAPDNNSVVSFPFELTWTAEDFTGTFALFFDTSPMRPDKPLRSLVEADDPCMANATCPDAQWLQERSIYLTKSTRFAVNSLPDLRGGAKGPDRHDVTLVLLDEGGQRVGESAFNREFIVEREG